MAAMLIQIMEEHTANASSSEFGSVDGKMSVQVVPYHTFDVSTAYM
jgi:hypothetical protein